MNKKNTIQVSIIIVYYRALTELDACLASIYSSQTKTTFEIIVVDNDEHERLTDRFKKKYPKILFIENKNNGFGAGNNKGAQHAKGEYLFFLNPDTIVDNKVLDTLLQHIESNSTIGVVAPFLLHSDKTPIKLQGFSELTPGKAVVALSFLNKIFPNNFISKKYWLPNWDIQRVKHVDTIPGTAFLLKRSLFINMHGFDENFFLYFEEFDLCKRIRDEGYEIHMVPGAEIIHLWGRSTSSRNDLTDIFRKSRFYYFRKHFGLLSAVCVDLMTRISKETLYVSFMLILGLFLFVYKLSDTMVFIGDQGWFYLSARDLLLGKVFPLVGITSSHTWLHQGPWWTYLLSVALFLGEFNPFSGAVLSVILGLSSIVALYVVGKKLFDTQTAIIATLFYTTSPLVIFGFRMPYHTVPIPLFTILFLYAQFGIIQGRKFALPLTAFCLAMLYNFELATTSLIAIPLILLLYGFCKNTKWIKTIITKKTITLSAVFFIIPNIPIFLYDISHGFPQTVVFMIWIMYRLLKALHIVQVQTVELTAPQDFYAATSTLLSRLLFLPSILVAQVLLSIGVFTPLYRGTVEWRSKSTVSTGLIATLLSFVVISGGYIVNQTASDAYTPVFFPVLILLLSFSIASFYKKWRVLVIVGVAAISIANVNSLLQQNFMVPHAGLTYKERVEAVKKIGDLRQGKDYQLIGKGTGSQFKSFLTPYIYLSWYYGFAPKENATSNTIIIEERNNQIQVRRSNL